MSMLYAPKPVGSFLDAGLDSIPALLSHTP
jgi:hypothetical protein